MGDERMHATHYSNVPTRHSLCSSRSLESRLISDRIHDMNVADSLQRFSNPGTQSNASSPKERSPILKTFERGKGVTFGAIDISEFLPANQNVHDSALTLGMSFSPRTGQERLN